jgi:branched-subunit amino acid transport protein AzlD
VDRTDAPPVATPPLRVGPPIVAGPPLPQAVVFLQVYALALTVMPSDYVIKAVGAAAHLAGLIGMLGFAWWATSALFGQHDPRRYPSPIRLTFVVLWICTLVSYLVMHLDERPLLEMNSADRFLMQLVTWTGVAMIAIEGCNTMVDFRKVLRTLSIGGAICGCIAAVQFWLTIDLAQYLRNLPGFSVNYDNAGIIGRSALARVAGTAIHPIELGVVAAAILPIAIFSARIETRMSDLRRWLPVMLIAVSVVVSVSRSAILTVVLSVGIFVVCLRPRPRATALLLAPFALVGVFMSAPGLIGTLRSYFAMGSNDPSVATRQSDYPLVERLVSQAPWFGRGGGTYLAPNAIDILDNEYLKMMIEFGLIGAVLIIVFYMIFPVTLAFTARGRSRNEQTRELGAALGASAAVSLVCAATFDAFSFPMFGGLHALIVGIIGAYWRFVRVEEQVGSPATDAATAPPLAQESP